MVIILHIRHYHLLYRILGSECYHFFLQFSCLNDRFNLCNIFFIESKPSRSCMLVQYQFVILDCTQCHAYISYDFTWVCPTIYHQFHYLYSCTLSSLHIYSYSYLTQDKASFKWFIYTYTKTDLWLASTCNFFFTQPISISCDTCRIIN